MTEPYPEHKIGHFMIGVGCVMEHQPSGKILCLKREGTNFQQGEWELMYGRIDQHEELFQALHRELLEETGITDFQIKKLLRVWHFYRGQRVAETEVHGFTFHCVTHSQDVQLSSEHAEYAWLEPAEAVQRIKVLGIKEDVKFFMDHVNDGTVSFSNAADQILAVL